MADKDRPGAPPHLSFWHQLRLVLWKNWLLTRRRPIGVFIELLLPLSLFLILVAVRHTIPDKDRDVTINNARILVPNLAEQLNMSGVGMLPVAAFAMQYPINGTNGTALASGLSNEIAARTPTTRASGQSYESTLVQTVAEAYLKAIGGDGSMGVINIAQELFLEPVRDTVSKEYSAAGANQTQASMASAVITMAIGTTLLDNAQEGGIAFNQSDIAARFSSEIQKYLQPALSSNGTAAVISAITSSLVEAVRPGDTQPGQAMDHLMATLRTRLPSAFESSIAGSLQMATISALSNTLADVLYKPISESLSNPLISDGPVNSTRLATAITQAISVHVANVTIRNLPNITQEVSTSLSPQMSLIEDTARSSIQNGTLQKVAGLVALMDAMGITNITGQQRNDAVWGSITPSDLNSTFQSMVNALDRMAKSDPVNQIAAFGDLTSAMQGLEQTGKFDLVMPRTVQARAAPQISPSLMQNPTLALLLLGGLGGTGNSSLGGLINKETRLLLQWADSLGLRLLYTPRSDQADQLIEAIAGQLKSSLPIFQRKFIYSFDTEDEMVAYAAKNRKKVWAGLTFLPSSSNQTLNYTLRMSDNLISTTKRIIYPWVRNGPRNFGRYINNGFAQLQAMVDTGFAVMQTNALPAWERAVRQQPWPAYKDDTFTITLARSMPLFMTLSWIFTASMIVKNIVYEKEKRLREAMKIMGLKNSVHWLGWFMHNLGFMLLSCLLLTIVVACGNVLPKTDPSVFFVFMVIFSVATIMLCFLVSVFFTKTKLAAAAGGIVYFVTYLPYIYVSINADTLTTGTKMASSLGLNTAFGLGVLMMAQWEEAEMGMQWSKVWIAPDPPNTFTFGHALIMLLIDTAIYGILAWYIDAVFPGKYGMPKPWNFFLQKEYWWPSSRSYLEALGHVHQSEVVEGAFACEEDPIGLAEGLRVENLVKQYGTKMALGGLSMTAFQGQITALLGHNGAGKSTTMNIITGLYPPSSGTAYIMGQDIRYSMDVIRRSLGICPQHNLLFGRLTVREHLVFFAMVKGCAQADAEEMADSMLEDLQLSDKANALPRALSGGMKRKLSVGISLIGGSKVVILDEPTAGMDPAARRATWELLLKNKTGRTMLLSTHFMDEADILGDRIAVIAKGQLQCMGSPLYLKAKYGSGYRLTFVKKSKSDLPPEDTETENDIIDTKCDVNRVLLLVQNHVPGSVLASDIGSEFSILLPKECATQFPNLLRTLDQSMSSLGVSSYGLSISTIEEVFLNIASRVDEDTEATAPSRSQWSQLKRKILKIFKKNKSKQVSQPMIAPATNKKMHSASNQNHDMANYYGATGESSSAGTSQAQSPAVYEHNHLPKKAIASAVPLGDDVCVDVNNSQSDIAMVPMGGSIKPKPQVDDVEEMASLFGRLHGGQRVAGSKLWVQQARAMVEKRWLSSKRDKKSLLFQLVLPAIFTVLAQFSATLTANPEDLPPLAMDTNMFTDPNYIPYKLNPAPANYSSVFASLPSLANQNDRFYEVGENETLASHFLNTHKTLRRKRWGGLAFGMNSPSNTSSKPTMLAEAWYNGDAYHAIPVFNNLMSNVLYREMLGQPTNPNARIYTTNHPWPKTAAQKAEELRQQGTEFLVAVCSMIALSFIPASFVLFLVSERVSKSKHLQTISGLPPSVYWATTALWDYANYVAVAAFIVVIYVAFQVPAYTAGSNLIGVILLLLLYGFSLTPIMYLTSFPFTVPSTAYIVALVTNLFLGITCSMATFVLDFFANEPDLQQTNTILKIVFLIFPNYCLGRGLMDLAYNQGLRDIPGLGTYALPVFHWQLLGKPLACMAMVGVVGYALVFWVDHLLERGVDLVKLFGSRDDAPPISSRQEDEDVAAEKERALKGGSMDDVLLVQDMSKVYVGRAGGVRAVDGVSFGVGKGECFGLLGVNGAGKTTLFKMLTGDIPASGGDAKIQGKSLRTELADVKHTFGYCPQFDALLDLMTGRETLQLFAAVRGISPESRDEMVDACIKLLGLQQHADRLAGSYSGGNKRKLSTAISLVGDPAILFMDEPTTGMDPRARRLLWTVVTAVCAKGTSIVLTTHSMDECEALCHRIGVMVRGQFRCLGTSQHLKTRFGRGYTLLVKLMRGALGEEPALVSYVQERFTMAELKESHSGMLQLHLPTAVGTTLGSVFETMEEARKRFEIEDYSVSQTTLERVFVNFANEAAEEEIASHKPGGLLGCCMCVGDMV